MPFRLAHNQLHSQYSNCSQRRCWSCDSSVLVDTLLVLIEWLDAGGLLLKGRESIELARNGPNKRLGQIVEIGPRRPCLKTLRCHVSVYVCQSQLLRSFLAMIGEKDLPSIPASSCQKGHISAKLRRSQEGEIGRCTMFVGLLNPLRA